MKKIIFFIFLLALSFHSFGQGSWTLSGTKNRWANGMGFGNKDTSTYTNASDTNLLVLQYPGSVLCYRHLLTDHWLVIAATGASSGYALTDLSNVLTTANLLIPSGTVVSNTMTVSGKISAGTLSVSGAATVSGIISAAGLTTSGTITSGQFIHSLTSINADGAIIAGGPMSAKEYLILNNTNFGPNVAVSILSTYNTHDGVNFYIPNKSVNDTIAMKSDITSAVASEVMTRTGTTVTPTVPSDGISTTGNITGTLISGTLSTAAQPNITSLGTISILTVSGNINSSSISNAGIIYSTKIGVGVPFGNTPINSIQIIGGNGLGLVMTNNEALNKSWSIVMGSGEIHIAETGLREDVHFLQGGGFSVTGSVISAGLTISGNASVSGIINASGLTASGTVTANNFVGTISTTSQPNITSVGTLTALTVSGYLNVGSINTTGIITAGGVTLTGTLRANDLIIIGGGIVGNLVTGNQSNINGVGSLISGSIGSGFGNIVTTSNIQAYNLTVTGNTGLGVSTTNYKLDVKGSASDWTAHVAAAGSSTEMYIGNTDGSGTFLNTRNTSGGVFAETISNGTNIIRTLSNSGVVTYSQLGTGAVQATAGVLSVISDSRAKNVTGKMNGSALVALRKMPLPQYWKYNSKSGMPLVAQKVSQFGLLADQVYKVLGEEFAPTQKNGLHSLNDRALLGLNYQIDQEQQFEIDALKKEINELKAAIKQLQKK